MRSTEKLYDHVMIGTVSISTCPLLSRSHHNPILSPHPDRYWENVATFNPAVICIDGIVHILYRAMGHASTSVLGYARSEDGVHMSYRSRRPAYVPRAKFETPGGNAPIFAHKYMSGGGYGGCEDPRLTQIGDTIYLTYVAYDGMNPPRVALSSIPLFDFLKERWQKWKWPILISEPGVVNKNACILPQKIRDKFVIFHRVYPNILVDYVDSLSFNETQTWLKEDYSIGPSTEGWDNRKVGAGAPPIKTPYGWLLIYHAVGEATPGQYKIGAMLLDLDNPHIVLHRSREPILAPDVWYENEGCKAGVVYPCGAVIKDDALLVYYGGADMVICVASAKANVFLEQLTADKPASIAPLEIENPDKVYDESFTLSDEPDPQAESAQ